MEPGEFWLVAPHFVDKKSYILAPSVKMGVSPQNYSFRTELFGPMLSVAPFDTLQEAIDLVNGLDYGLTSGIQTLDENERRLWRDSIMAGNLYINRGITGAIVNRQPFGGMKLSAFDPGIKAGARTTVSSSPSSPTSRGRRPIIARAMPRHGRASSAVHVTGTISMVKRTSSAICR